MISRARSRVTGPTSSRAAHASHATTKCPDLMHASDMAPAPFFCTDEGLARGSAAAARSRRAERCHVATHGTQRDRVRGELRLQRA
jgi:hypothetical protein